MYPQYKCCVCGSSTSEHWHHIQEQFRNELELICGKELPHTGFFCCAHLKDPNHNRRIHGTPEFREEFSGVYFTRASIRNVPKPRIPLGMARKQYMGQSRGKLRAWSKEELIAALKNLPCPNVENPPVIPPTTKMLESFLSILNTSNSNLELKFWTGVNDFEQFWEQLRVQFPERLPSRSELS
jgi:hypothetical protein